MQYQPSSPPPPPAPAPGLIINPNNPGSSVDPPRGLRGGGDAKM